MIESSVIKVILIVALNMCFVWVWVKKENLRSVMPFKIIRKVEEKVFLKNCKKTKGIISFIGNMSINIFWIFNVLYVIVIAKAFEKILDITLGFSYGIRYIEKTIETPFFRIDYFGVKTLDEIAAFILDIGNMPTLFVGLTGMLVAIYIYAVSVDNKLKKFMLLTLLGKEELFYLSFYIVILFIFGSESVFLLGPIGYLIYRLVRSVYWIIKVNSESSYKEVFEKVMENIFTENEQIDLYIGVKKQLYKMVKMEELQEIEEYRYYFNKFLDVYKNKITYVDTDIKYGKIIKFLYDLYEIVYEKKDDRIFQEISYLHIKLAEYYLRDNDKENFYWALCGMEKVYDYHYRNGTDKFELRVVDAFRFDYLGIWKKYKENFEDGIEWYSQMFKAITEGIKKSVINEDFYFFQQFTYLIEHQFKYQKEIKKDYKLLEKSVYFGILLYLKEEKRKSKDNEDRLKKMDEYIEFIERLLSNNNLIDLIELYEFIGEEIYGWNEEYKDRLNWDKYYEGRNLVRVSFDPVRTDGEKNKLFFELLGKVRNFKVYENRLLEDECLELLLKRLDDEERKKLIKRIDKFKKKIGWLLSELKQQKEELSLINEEYEQVKGLFEKIRIKIKNKEEETVVELEISERKITIFKKKLEKILSESKIIRWLKDLGKYKGDIKEEKGKTRYIGQYMQKEYFVELGNEGGTKAIAESYGKEQNRAIEQIIIESIEVKKEDTNSIEKALEKIKGKPWIILTGIDMFSFFYEESGKSRKNIVLSSDLDNGYFEKYGEILEGIYKYKGTEIPIYNFSSDKKGIYILDSDDIVEFIHYDAKEEDENSKNIEKRFDKKVGYSHLTIIETEKIIKSGEIDKILKSGILKDYETKEEKLNKFKQLVWITFVQKGELKLKDNAVVYKVEFNG
ncbi:MAG: hypothetical protein WBG30_09920 [Psychrilyobacter sp.]|uniref:hypothetical protein n=1 Tax=Psychrilyobacter sp. TaxID=2586924 RepID=UPI003C71B151